MRNRFRHLRRDERGMTYVFVGLGFMAFMSATTIAVDVGMAMTARSQAQNAADAGALAGAIALGFNDYDDRSAGGPAVQSAISAALENQVMRRAVDVTPADVTFPLSPTGQNNRVRVNVHRTSARNNPIPTLIGAVFGVRTVDIIATATAHAAPASAVTCVKPFMIPDRWDERQTGPWDTTDSFEMYDNKGNLLANRDIYVGDLASTEYTGYSATRDRGLELMLRAGTGNNIEPTMYYSWKMPGGDDEIGADYYRENIAACNQHVARPGDILIQEPGNMMGPTTQGADDLIATDPGAYWDFSCGCVKGSRFGVSPRVFPIPVFDPVYYATGKTNGRNADFKVSNFIGFFLTSRVGNNVYGRITPISGLIDANAGPAPAGAFPMAIQLVE
jgi:Flp pilus assembly protein TadG